MFFVFVLSPLTIDLTDRIARGQQVCLRITG
jgi:hypothetical protein